MKTANLKWVWVTGLSGAYRVCLVGTGEPLIDGMVMGTSMEEAKAALVEFNSRRAGLNLSQFRV